MDDDRENINQQRNERKTEINRNFSLTMFIKKNEMSKYQ